MRRESSCLLLKNSFQIMRQSENLGNLEIGTNSKQEQST
jgi:hypothetical protein